MTRKQALEALLSKIEAGNDSRGIFKAAMEAMPNNTDELLAGAFNGSLDAALALHEAAVPNMYIRSIVQRWRGIWEVCLWPDTDPVNQSDMIRCGSSDPARAWLMAIIKALIAMEGE